MASAVVMNLHTKAFAKLFPCEVLPLILFANDANEGTKQRNQALKFLLRLIRDYPRNILHGTKLDVSLRDGLPWL